MKAVSDPELKTQFESYKNAVEAKVNQNFATFTPVRYSSQVVAGMNYKIVYSIGNDKQVLVQVYQPPPYTNDPVVVNSAII